jgi:hypothetical protein
MTKQHPKDIQAFEEAKTARKESLEEAKAAREAAIPPPSGGKPSQFQERIMEGLRRLSKEYKSESAMSRWMGLSQPTVNKVLDGKQIPRLDSLGKIMDKAGARVVFPWEKENLTRRISLAGKIHAPEYRVVDRFDFDREGTVFQVEGGGLVLTEAKLKELSTTLSLGVFMILSAMRDMMPEICPGDDVLVDFAQRPGEEEEGDKVGAYLVRFRDGSVRCKKVAREAGTYLVYDISGRTKPTVLMEGGFYKKIEDAIIGKIVYVIRGMA